MDRTLRRLAAALLLAALCLAGAWAQEPPAPPSAVGPFFDRLPVTREGGLLAPLAPLAAWLELQVQQTPAGAITLTEAQALAPLIEMRLGDKRARLNGHPYDLPVAPQVIDGEVYAPLRFLVEAAGFWVELERHTLTLELPQENLKVDLSLPPDPASQQELIWKQLGLWYGLPPDALPADPVKLPHWNLFSAERKQELLAEIGRDAPTLLETHWNARAVAGVRIISDATDPEGGAAEVQVIVKYADGGIYEDDFSFVLESGAWKVRKESSSQVPSG